MILWKQCGLIIKGKIAFVNAKALPLITYVTNFVHVQINIMKIIDKIVYKFVWKKKKQSIIEKKWLKGD